LAYTDINSEDRLVQATFANHLERVLGWESVYAWNDETFGPTGTLGRADTATLFSRAISRQPSPASIPICHHRPSKKRSPR
jgi:hypothetical protein